jgi:hypothetical protein
LWGKKRELHPLGIGTGEYHLSLPFQHSGSLLPSREKDDIDLEHRISTLGPCLVPQKFYKIFQIPRHIESLDVCMEY